VDLLERIVEDDAAAGENVDGSAAAVAHQGAARSLDLARNIAVLKLQRRDIGNSIGDNHEETDFQHDGGACKCAGSRRLIASEIRAGQSRFR
jgi:hypothetical protein